MIVILLVILLLNHFLLVMIKLKMSVIAVITCLCCIAEVRPPYSNRLIDLDIVRVEDALNIQRLILGFKILNDLATTSFDSYIQHSRLVNTRLLHQASRTSSFFNSMFISLPRLWDEIPYN